MAYTPIFSKKSLCLKMECNGTETVGKTLEICSFAKSWFSRWNSWLQFRNYYWIMPEDCSVPHILKTTVTETVGNTPRDLCRLVHHKQGSQAKICQQSIIRGTPCRKLTKFWQFLIYVRKFRICPYKKVKPLKFRSFFEYTFTISALTQ